MTPAQRAELSDLQRRRKLLGALGKPAHACPIRLSLPIPCRVCQPRKAMR